MLLFLAWEFCVLLFWEREGRRRQKGLSFFPKPFFRARSFFAATVRVGSRARNSFWHGNLSRHSEKVPCDDEEETQETIPVFDRVCVCGCGCGHARI